MHELANLIDYIPSKYGNITLLERGAKKHIDEEVQFYPDDKVRWQDLLDLGFTPDFIERTGLDLLEFLKEKEFPKEEKSYIRRLVDKYGLKVLLNKPNLELGTFHSVKGDEATRVIIDPTYTKRPFDNLIQGMEEEDRLIYTAITRSSSDVVILHPSGVMYYDI
jgi:superfamily I DNA/RNA helicase